MMSRVCLFILFVAVIGLCDGYTTKGNKIYDKNGKAVLLRGLDRPGFEWSPTGASASLADYKLMSTWGGNVVRLATNQDFWLPGARNYSSGYQALIEQQVQDIKSVGMSVIIDLHWSDKGDMHNVNPTQQRMADSNSVLFWQQVATKFKNDPDVIFELYNEPHDVSWDVWLNGGPSGDGFEVAGMQKLYDTVRATGAENLVLIGGLNWAYDLSGVPSHRVKGINIAYATHPYDFSGKEPNNWDSGFGFLAATDPVVATEFGEFKCNPSYVSQFVAYANAKGISWTAWAWFPGGCAFPSVIDSWNGTPSEDGKVIQKSLKSDPKIPN